ncbi:MAG TPA: ChaB family protein [Acidimicrobiales bacterium]|jgi:cation transport regulator ChaB
MPTKKEDLPGTLKRSPAKAQRTYAKALDSAHETYDSEEAAHRVAFAAVKHSFEKQGDHWEPKDEKGPSDPQAAKGGAEARRSRTPTGGGKVVGTTKKELMEQARELDVPGRSKMSKDELTEAVAKAKK